MADNPFAKYAQPNAPLPSPPKVEKPDIPSGYEADGQGGLRPIRGGPADPARDSKKTWRPMTAEEKAGQGLVGVFQVSSDGEIKSVDTKQGAPGKALRQGDSDKLDAAVNGFAELTRLTDSFIDSYSGNTALGGAETGLQRLTGVTGTPGQADWWSAMDSLDNQIRNDLFGATLTPGEKAAYFRTTVSPRMAPSEARKNLKRRQEIMRKALARKVNGLKAAGWNEQEIDAKLGEVAPRIFPGSVTMENAPPDDSPPPGSPLDTGDGAPAQSVATGSTRNVPLTRANALVNAMMNAGRSKAQIDAALSRKGLPPISAADYSAAKAWIAENPGKRYNRANLTRPERLSLLEKTAASAPGAFVAQAADAMTAGTVGALAGDEGRGALDAMRQMHPVSSTAGTIGGGVAGALGLELGVGKALLGKLPNLAARTGDMIYGGVSGANAADEGQGVAGAFLGAGAGLAGGLAGQYLAAPVADAVMRTKGGQLVSEGVRAAVNKVRPGTLADKPNVPQFAPGERAIPQVPDSVKTNLQDAADMGLPYALADADPKLRMLAGSVSRKSPDARQLAENTFQPRAEDQAERAITGISENLAPPVDIAARKQDWRKTANERSRPLYEEAYQGGSTAPLENQLQDAFNASSKAVADARAELAAAQRGATVSSAQVNRAGNNVYQNAQALPADRAANQAISGAEQRLRQAEAQHAQVLEQLRRSQGDAASSAPGAVWNPRLQQFIDDPLSKAGLARGLEIQRLEALAEGRPFDPTEYAVIGTDQAGNPIVGNVPNLRTLDAIKKGYDAILDEYPRDMKGNQIFDQRGRAITMAKQSLVKELDDVTGGELGPYASARNTYGTYAQLGETLGEGYDAAARGTYARDIQTRLGGMDEANLGEFQAGYATRLRDMAADTTDNADPYRTIYGGNERRAKMATVFPEGSQKFGRRYELEQDMAKTRNETLGGSPTAGRLAADEMFDGPGAAAIDIGSQAITGGGVPAVSIARTAARALGDNWRLGMGREKADALAPVLFDDDPRAALAYIDDLTRRQRALEERKREIAQTYGLLGAGTAGSMVGE